MRVLNNILSQRIYRQIFLDNLKNGYPKAGIQKTSDTILTAYWKREIKQFSKTKIIGSYKGKNIN